MKKTVLFIFAVQYGYFHFFVCVVSTKVHSASMVSLQRLNFVWEFSKFSHCLEFRKSRHNLGTRQIGFLQCCCLFLVVLPSFHELQTLTTHRQRTLSLVARTL